MSVEAGTGRITAFGGRQASLDAFLSYGFRPFFLGSAIYAVCAMAVWMAAIGAQQFGGSADWLPVAGSIYAWHAHEMVFGFGIAAVAGFLLTAVPNWTGALPLSGRPLLLLFGVWLAGRLAMAFSGLLPAVLVATTDLIFVPLLGAFATRQLFVKPAPRNLIFLVILALIFTGNGAYHLGIDGIYAIDGLAGVRLALVLLVLMIAVVGGRIVPAFTHNWLHVNAIPGGMPRRYPWLDITSIASVFVFSLLQIMPAPDVLVGVAALVAGLANGLRLTLWRGLATWRAPIVWVLHVGYAWIVIGMLLAAMGGFAGGIWSMAAMHAFGVGAVGTMILAVMSRASLGHTGRPLVAPRSMVVAFYLITLAAVLRVFGAAVVPSHYPEILLAAGSAWMASFALFIYVFAPILVTPRISMVGPEARRLNIGRD